MHWKREEVHWCFANGKIEGLVLHNTTEKKNSIYPISNTKNIMVTEKLQFLENYPNMLSSFIGIFCKISLEFIEIFYNIPSKFLPRFFIFLNNASQNYTYYSQEIVLSLKIQGV